MGSRWLCAMFYVSKVAVRATLHARHLLLNLTCLGSQSIYDHTVVVIDCKPKATTSTTTTTIHARHLLLAKFDLSWQSKHLRL